MESKTNLETEVKQWLQSVLKAENLKDFSVKIVGNSEKGDGYLGDIVFVDVDGISEDEIKKEYSFVLKCSKRSEKLRTQEQIKEIFLNEIAVYEEIIPAFVQFEKEKKIEEYFDSIAKYYGKFVSDSIEVIVFQNLKKIGYDLWDMKKPLTRKHIDVVTGKYAQFHAISVAMNDQKPKEFRTLRDKLEKVFEENSKSEDIFRMFEKSIEEVYDLLRNDLNENILLKWHNLIPQVLPTLKGSDKPKTLKVISHGDCWNNNFMYLCEKDNKELPKKVAILDWQGSRFVSPIFDLSYFLFTCISEEDLLNLDTILEYYYKSFANHLQKLGSQAFTLYPYEEFLNDWTDSCKYGIIIASLLHKVCTTEKDEVIDIGESADQGKSFASSFSYEIRNKEGFKNRIRPIVKYAAEHDLI